MYFAFLDESGNTASFQPSESFLVVAVIMASDKVARSLALHMKRVKRGAGVKAPELKARDASPKVRKRLLKAISREDLAIISVVIDKRVVVQEPKDAEDWYREAASRAVLQCVRRQSQLRLTLDKRYTSVALRDRLERAIWGSLGELASNVAAIEHLDSHASLDLQVVDYAAWAIRAKYETGDHSGYDLIKEQIVTEEVIEAK